ncbi:MAG: MoxR family ATPase [Saprospiraceae bacterium]|nr:MoxR family ATPase [Saprospiraceae bacterium]
MQISFDYVDGQFVAKSTPTNKQESIMPYIPNPDIIEVVKMARLLQRPILLRGEPGCGKTQLAKAVAYELYKEVYPETEQGNYRKHYFEWHIKSHSKAQEGLYSFDHIARLREANRKDAPKETSDSLKEYRELGPLGKAFAVSTEEQPAILLIDEIDKADIDFPNDLLLELDEKRFQIRETKEEINSAGHPPLIFITSNQEKELPSAFLRRCLFLYIEFPQGEVLNSIINARFQEWVGDDQFAAFIGRVKTKFQAIRDSIASDVTTSKQVSTGELLDWINYLVLAHGMDVDIQESQTKAGAFPGYQALLKNMSDLSREKIIKK